MTSKPVKLLALAIGLVILFALPAAAGDNTRKIPGYVLTELQVTCLEVGVTSGNPKSISDVALLTKSPNERVRAMAAYTLGESRNSQAIEYLMPLLRDQDHHVQRIAATAMGKIGDKSTVPSLVLLLNTSQKVPVKVATIKALGQIGGDGSLTAIEKHADSQHGWVRHAVVEARERLGSSQKVIAQK